MKRHADLDDLSHVPIPDDRHREQPNLARAAARNGLEGLEVPRRIAARVGRELEYLWRAPGRPRFRTPLGVEDPEELVIELGTQELTEETLGLRLSGRPLP